MKHIRSEAVAVVKRRPQAASAGGFTLLELLISMTLLVLVVVIAAGAIRLSSRSVAKGEKKMEAQERLRTVLFTLDAQISSHIPLTYQEEGEKRYYFRGEKKGLRFSTSYSIWGSRKGCVIVTYKVEDQDGQEVLSAVEERPGHEGRQETRLLNASAVSFEYFLQDAAEGRGKWVEESADGLTIPEKIRVHVSEGSSQMSLVFPVRAIGKMVTVQSGVRPRSQ